MASGSSLYFTQTRPLSNKWPRRTSGLAAPTAMMRGFIGSTHECAAQLMSRKVILALSSAGCSSWDCCSRATRHSFKFRLSFMKTNVRHALVRAIAPSNCRDASTVRPVGPIRMACQSSHLLYIVGALGTGKTVAGE
eukprot:7946938-Pyramimonas_sp.AAC.1